MTALATISTTQQPIKPPQEAKTLRINGKNKAAIDHMVWDGLTRAKAAAKAGLKDHALYVALTKPHVKAYYMQQLEVLRTSERARNIHTLVDVRDQKKNQMARVNAVKALELIDDIEQTGRGTQSLPGLQIVVIQGGTAAIQASQPVPAITIEHSSDMSHVDDR